LNEYAIHSITNYEWFKPKTKKKETLYTRYELTFKLYAMTCDHDLKVRLALSILIHHKHSQITFKHKILNITSKYCANYAFSFLLMNFFFFSILFVFSENALFRHKKLSQ
jgi:hypothetical protein